MGGFEGGDEGGFWDIDAISTLIKNQDTSRNKDKEKPYIQTHDSSYSIKAHAKINIFFKVTQYQNQSYSYLSRVVRINEIYDTISFVPCQCDTFTLEGCNHIPLVSNTIYKAYQSLLEYTADSDIADFFQEHKVLVKKTIPSGSGLGASASHAAAFLRLTKEVCNLVISTTDLAHLGKPIHNDIPFFVHNYPSANVSGSGEIVEEFHEEPLDIELYTPEIKCDKIIINQDLSLNTSLFSTWANRDSKSILALSSDPALFNDLYASLTLTSTGLYKSHKAGYFFSGSSFFKVR